MELSQKDSLIQYISDAHKDAYGFRPRGHNYDDWSIEQLEKECDRLEVAVQHAFEEEKIQSNRNVASFEESIANLISMGANNRNTAIRWICDAYDHGGDLGFVCYMLGLPYGMEAELQEAV